jgi:hypothetical protein
MKLPSMQRISRSTLETAFRFPLPLAASFIGTAAAVIIVGHKGPAQPTPLWGLLFGGILGLPLFTGVTLYAERRQWNSVTKWIMQLVPVVLVVAYALTVPAELTEAPARHTIRLLMLAFASHLFVAVAPFCMKGQVNGFWQYNKTLFLRILGAALFAHVAFAGLAFALAALDNLFGMNIPPERYAQLWVLACGLFATTFFLAGVPKDLDGLETSSDFPGGLKIFAQYVLLPIVVVYLAILYAYLGKILITWDWPQGWVSKLILGFSATGTLSLLLLYPVSRDSTNTWIRTLVRWFYVILIPVLIMLFFAIWRRVSEYGITEGRYLAVALGIWLVIIIAYFLLFPRKSIKFIPASLFIGTLLVTYGPWGVFTVSEQSQVSRLETILKRNAMLVDARVKKADGIVPSSDVREVSAVLSYLHDIHGYESIQPWFDQVLRDDSARTGVGYRDASSVVNLLGLEYVQPRREAQGVVILRADENDAWVIKGFDHLLRAERFFERTTRRELAPGAVSCQPSTDLDSLVVVLQIRPQLQDSVQFDIASAVRGMVKEGDRRGSTTLPSEVMTLKQSSGNLSVMLCIPEVCVEHSTNDIRILWYHADVLYTRQPGAVTADAPR